MRGVRSLFPLFLLGTLALAAAAGAGTAIVIDPYSTESCGETDYAGTLGDPNGAYSALVDCPGLCRLAEAECRSLDKLTFSCQDLIVSKRTTWSKANCTATISDKAQLKICKQDAKTQASMDKQAVKSALSNALQGCSDWSTVCQNTCGAP